MNQKKPELVSTRFLSKDTERFEFSNCMARVHKDYVCEPDYPCTIHRPSEHKMRAWPMLLRESGLIERTCSHGVGHPDPDSTLYFRRTTNQASWGVHGCDGCCHD